MIRFSPRFTIVAVLMAITLGGVSMLPSVEAQSVSEVGQGDAYKLSQLSATTSSAVGLSSSDVSPSTTLGAKSAYCSVETNSVRYRYDGTAPTTTVGHLAPAGTTIVVTGVNNLLNLKFIGATATGTVFCTLQH